MGVPLDFSNVQDYAAIPSSEENGEPYRVKVAESAMGSSKRSSQPKWRMTLLVVEPEAFAGRKLFLEHSLQDQALWAVARTIGALTGEEISSDTGEFNFDPEQYVGLEALAVVSVDSSYDGTPRNKVDRLTSLAVSAK